MPIDIYEEVTNKIIQALEEKAVVPWRQPFAQGIGGLPMNLTTGKPYRGANIFMLALTGMGEGYRSPYWLTYKQAAERGAQVKRGSKSTPVIFWKQLKVKDKASDKDKVVPMVKYYRVFNAEQCDNLDYPRPDQVVNDNFEPIDEAERIVREYKEAPQIVRPPLNQAQASYSPSSDTVTIPEPQTFIGTEEYYATLFHELAHSTGHKSRLDRGISKLPAFGSPDYSKEELIAECGAAFLCAVAGIAPATLDNQTAYIKGWLSKLRGDKKLVVQAAAAGQRAADWIQNQRYGR